jgi:hypothetical protein
MFPNRNCVMKPERLSETTSSEKYLQQKSTGAEALFLLCARCAALKRRSSTVLRVSVVGMRSKPKSKAAGEGARSTTHTLTAAGSKGPLTVRGYKTRVGDEVVTTFSSFQVP